MLKKNRNWLYKYFSSIPIHLFLVFTSFVHLDCYPNELIPFRFFTSQDGLKESWVTSVTVGPSGTAWINHGDVDEMSFYDGFQIQTMPSPGADVTIKENTYHEIWAVKTGTLSGFQQYKDGIWIEYDIPGPAWMVTHSTPFIPLSSQQILYLLPDALLSFNADDGNIRIIKTIEDTNLGRFRDMTESPRDGIWITGENGIAHIPLIHSESKIVIGGEWQEYLLPVEMSAYNLEKPVVCGTDELFMTGVDTETQKGIAIHFRKDRFDRLELPVSGNVLAVWRGHDHSLWVVSGIRTAWDLYHICGDRIKKIPKNRILSGTFFHFTIEPDCSFWIAASTGLVRYAPLPWRTPSGLERFDDFISSAYQDPQGRLWFACKDRLLLLQNEQWHQYPYPQDFYIQSMLNVHLCYLPDDRILLNATEGSFQVFHVKEERFETLNHPQGSYITRYSPQKDNTILLLANDQDAPHRLERFDGDRFEMVYEPLENSETGFIRAIWKAQNGDIWLGGLKGAARIRNGEYQVFDTTDGYTGYGAFCITELSDGSIWLGGRDNIIQYAQGEWTSIRSSNLETVRSIFPASDGAVWVASGSGIHRYKNGSWITHFHLDGLPDTTALQVIEDTKNRLWTATMNGLRLYDSEADILAPQTYISSHRNLSTTPPGGEVRLHFEGTDQWRQTESSRLLYSYSLDGNSWSPFSADTIFSATHLNPGQHKFQVRAMDRSWNIDPTPAVFTFTVLFPWYQTPGFLLITTLGSIIILVLLGYAVSRYTWLEKMVAQRTAELSKKESSYRTLVENLQQYVFLKDREFRFQSANSSFCKLLGVPLEQITGKTDYDFFPEELAGKYHDDDERIVHTGDTIQTIEENMTEKGRRWVEVVKTPIKDDDGNITGILGIFWDITERILVQDKLRKNQELLETTQKAAHVGGWTTDLQTHTLIWTDEIYRIFGLDRTEFDGTIETFYSFIHPDDMDAVRSASENAIRTRTSYGIDHRIVRPDGSIRWVHEQAEVIKDHQGEPIQLSGTVQDITERKLIEEKIQDLAKFPTENPNPVMRVTNDGILLFANKPSQVLLDFWEVRIGTSLPEDMQQLIAQAYDTKENKEIEIDCQKNIFELMIAPVPDTRYVNLYGVEVTEKKLLEEQFRQAQKMEAIGQLAGGVAHDFNNLIMAILGYSQFLQDGLDKDSPLHKDVEEIIKASNRAASLTQQLLAFSRKQVLKPEILDLNGLIHDMDKMLCRLIGEEVELVTHLNPEIGMIKADPGQIQQIIMNLAVNARDAMPQGGRLSLETSNVILDENYAHEHMDVHSGPYVQLAVCDTGCGIEKDMLSRIFDPFFTTKQMGKGTGLGLSTVYGIVKQSGGHIWVYSEPGSGTTFKIYFPKEEEHQERKSEHTESHPATLSGNEAILLVEDEIVVRNFVARTLKEKGYTILEASDGKEALAIAQHAGETFDLLITDVIMPRMNGAELAAAMANTHPDTKVLYMSGYTDDEIAHHGVLEPDIHFIQKPFNVHDLLVKIRSILD